MNNTPTAVLEREHDYIQRVVAALVRQSVAIEAGGEPDLPFLERAVDFLRTYSDRCHHGKEEEILFPLLEQRGVPGSGCPLGALRHDHVAGRVLVTDLANTVEDRKNGHAVAAETLVAALRGITDLYPGHIWKEDYLLFPMTGKVLTEDDLAEIARTFEEFDRTMGWAVIRRCEGFAEDLEV